MADRTDARFEAAEARGRDLLRTAPRAAAARYDSASGRVVIELIDGCAYAFPIRLVQDLQGATEAELGTVQVDGHGLNLHWPALDADLYVPALIAGIFGTEAWMKRELASRAGRSEEHTSELPSLMRI